MRTRLDTGFSPEHRPLERSTRLPSAVPLASTGTPHAGEGRQQPPFVSAISQATGLTLGQSIATLQGASRYAQQLTSALDQLHNALMAQPAADGNRQARLESCLAQVTGLLETRLVASGNTIDDQLKFHPKGDARQHFSIKGLNLQSLGQAPQEKLVLRSGQQVTNYHNITVGDTPQTDILLSRLDKVLARQGIRVVRDNWQELAFSSKLQTPETQLRQLAIKGEGIRFDASHFQPLDIRKQAALFHPQDFRFDSQEAIRHASKQTNLLRQRSRQCQQDINSQLQGIASGLEQVTNTARANRQQQFVQHFAAQSSASFDFIQQLVPAMTLRRDQVESILSSVLQS